MTVRITRYRNCKHTILQVDGRLHDADVALLTRECAEAELPVLLDLSELHYAATAGAEALWDLFTQGADLRGVSPYVRLMLQSQADRDSTANRAILTRLHGQLGDVL